MYDDDTLAVRVTGCFVKQSAFNLRIPTLWRRPEPHTEFTAHQHGGARRLYPPTAIRRTLLAGRSASRYVHFSVREHRKHLVMLRRSAVSRRL